MEREFRQTRSLKSEPEQHISFATVEVNSDELSRVKLQPGMPVEAAIITSRRTMLAFLFQPLTDSFAHAFREE